MVSDSMKIALRNNSLSQTLRLGFSLSSASVLGVLGGCPGCQKCS